MGSPVSTWDGADAYFTFADRPGVLYLCFALMLVIVAGVVINAMTHEKLAAKKLEESGYS